MNPIKLRESLEKKFSSHFQLDVGEGGFVLLTVISDRFRNKMRSERLQEVEPLIQQAGLISGIIELYTPEEADSQNLSITETKIKIPTSWQEAINLLDSGKTLSKKIKSDHPIKRVVFYSYKGGVGRTTALIQTAFQLIRSEKRVVVVDMDVEAPGLQTLLPPVNTSLKAGLIDYLWERQTCFLNEENSPNIELSGESGIVYTIEDRHSKRPLFVVPAGKIDRRYVKRLSVLVTAQLFGNIDDPWFQFERELWQQFQPDVMLIDARTGLNEWGALSLLELADDAFITLYPSEQNAEGIRFIINILKELGSVNTRLILSPVPEGVVGASLVDRIKNSLELNSKGEEIIQIPYHPNIAGSTEFPVEVALPYYSKIANYLLEEFDEIKANLLISSSNRLEIVRSLSFPERDASSILDADFDTIFQKTTDFDRCLDDAVWVIRGRKGTGKSTLYRLFTQYPNNADKRSRGRLDNITILSAHGDSDQFRPTVDLFEIIHNKIKAAQKDWLSLWRGYALVRIYRSCADFSEVLQQRKSKLLLKHLDSFNKRFEIWEDIHTNKLIEIAVHEELNLSARDALSYYNEFLKKEAKKIWLLYDDLDQDIREGTDWQQDALGGLMRFIYDLNNQGLYNIRFKVFLREDIWNRLIFTNKSHFGEARTLPLQWGQIDFLRLAYRLAIGGSIEFKTLASRILPLVENEIDEASEDVLRSVLAPLWGLRQKGRNAYVSQWVYSRLTDSSDNTYPRSLTILLNNARQTELEFPKRKVITTDRLLSWNSLTKGLEEASKERCNAIKNEYREFTEFFNHIKELSSLFNLEDLRVLWERTVQNKNNLNESFDSFVTRLEQIGLIARKKYPKRYAYSVADLYVYGFEVKRKQGQRK